MTLTAKQKLVNDTYQKVFGRDAQFGSLGGADYWTDQDLTEEQLTEHLQWSPEGQTVTTDSAGNKSSWLGGVNPNQSIANTWAADAAEMAKDNPDLQKVTWANHFQDGGALSGNLDGTIWEGMAGAGTTANPSSTKNVAGLLNATYNKVKPDSGFPSPYFQNDPITKDTVVPGTDNQTFAPPPATNTGGGLTLADLDSWWAKQNQPKSGGGMDDFMKFMMMMSVMGGGRGMGGGGGYGGSQYGYGGLNPGGVQAAYNPWENMTKGWDFMKNNFGSGSGTTTDNINVTGTA